MSRFYYSEPTDTDLSDRIEYDMDDQDECWLEAYNALQEPRDREDENLFEEIMDRFEKEWFDLTTRDDGGFPEDSTCAICDDGEAENSNAIVFCDGCNLAVHQDCYGVPFIPEGQWLCRKCMISPEMPVTCIFCPIEGGAFKQTNTGKWAHLLCALWIPEVSIANPTLKEPIENIDKIPKGRWRLTCYICRQKCGAPIQCASKQCFLAFHVSCARKAKLHMKMRGYDGQAIPQRAFCDKHTPVSRRFQLWIRCEGRRLECLTSYR
ncbi:PHD-zinc-finger like domain-containing protein [Blyttiomyces helicus]|uniref:PHD-zinc-finger like domain-containing protein n=1 Tax=Blyttiomyces helicus TaxID=388810 RepID=A0A4P9WHG0_9FUNG|nr:PHD-zinc-finger like domain-containing protein [Blyttiomyces helicus]|eukprot:RKO90520.1 PHD-zinc-finger like domain-containing protein [Blyttiomyces helicus]